MDEVFMERRSIELLIPKTGSIVILSSLLGPPLYSTKSQKKKNQKPTPNHKKTQTTESSCRDYFIFLSAPV